MNLKKEKYCLPDKWNGENLPEYFIKSPFLNIIKAESEKKRGRSFFYNEEKNESRTEKNDHFP